MLNLRKSQRLKHVEVSTSVSEINRIVRHNPTELKFMFKSPTEDKRRLTKLISHLVPYRVGIEFETFGAVGQNLYPTNLIKSTDSTHINHKIRDKLKLADFREDEHIDPPINQVYTLEDRSMNEVRISFHGYKQLIPFWNSMQLLKKCLIIPKINGGIHIHIDAPFVKDKLGKDYAVKWFSQSSILTEIIQIFEGYKGTFNSRGASTSKTSWIRVSNYPTVEFRIARLTYEYKTLVRWIIACSDLVRRCKTDYYNHYKIPLQNSKTQSATEPTLNSVNVQLNQESTTIDRISILQDQVDALTNLVTNSRYNLYTTSGSTWSSY